MVQFSFWQKPIPSVSSYMSENRMMPALGGGSKKDGNCGIGMQGDEGHGAWNVHWCPVQTAVQLPPARVTVCKASQHQESGLTLKNLDWAASDFCNPAWP